MYNADYHSLCWDSQFFGFPVGSLNAIEKRPNEACSHLANIIRHPPCRLLYVQVNPKDSLTGEYLTHSGAQLVDNRIDYHKNINTRQPNNPTKVGTLVKSYEGDECQELYELAFLAGTFSRYRTDPKISEFEFQRLYTLWIERSVSGDFADNVLVTRDQYGLPSSLITLSYKEDIGKIGLLAVRSDQQGSGLGSLLVNNALEYFSDKLCTSVEVATQATNTAACKLYEKTGFARFRSSYTYHLWLPFTCSEKEL